MVKRAFLAVALPLVAMLGACGEAGEVYPRAASDVRQTLRGLELPAIIDGYAASVRVVEDGDGGVIWYLSDGTKDVLRFVARTEAVDEGHTRVTVELKPPTDAPDDPAKKRLEDNASAANVYLTAMVEQIDSTLENRPYDHAKIATAAAIGIMGSMGEISDRMDEEAARYREQDANNIADAYAQEAQGAWSSEAEYADEPAFGEPMDDPSPGSY